MLLFYIRGDEMSKNKENTGINMSAKSFLTSILVILVLMVLTYGLTFVIPGGGIPFWKWALSPILVLGADGNVSLIAIIIFLLVIGGVFNCLDKCGLMQYMLDTITNRFAKEKYKLLVFVSLFFMSMGSFIGSFEEAVPLVPIVVALAIRLGWDALTGLGMSLLAIGCGFSTGVCNPFTVGVAQEIAGLPMFSGIWFRLIGFALVYAMLVGFLYLHAKKIEKPINTDALVRNFKKDEKMDKALKCFIGIMCSGILLVLSSVFLTFLQDITMIIVAITFLAAGIISVIYTGRGGNIFRTFMNGVGTVFPAVFMILMANSIKYTMEEGNIINTILQAMIATAEVLPDWTIILFIYFIVLVMNFFISSGSAKVFLLMPLILPIAETFGISAQLCIVAFAFSDGFSDMLYPTNPILLISLGLADVDYGTWFKWSWKFQGLNLLLTSGILLLGFAIGY